MASLFNSATRRYRRPSRGAARECRQTRRLVRPAIFSGCRATQSEADRAVESARKSGLSRRPYLRDLWRGGGRPCRLQRDCRRGGRAGMSRSLAGDRLDLRADSRTAWFRGIETQMAARARQRRYAPRLCDHRARRRHQHPQDQHRRATRQPGLDPPRDQILDFRGRRSRFHPRRCARRTLERRRARSPFAFHRIGRRRGPFEDADRDRAAGPRDAIHACSSTMSRYPRMRWSASKDRDCATCSPV